MSTTSEARRAFGGQPIIIAQNETNRLLARDNDPNRPLATVTFDDRYRLAVSSQVLELSYRGTAHAPGNIHLRAQTANVDDRRRRLSTLDAVASVRVPQDIPEYFAQVKEISTLDFDILVGGHVVRTGTRADAATPLAFMEDLKSAAETALKRTVPGEGLNPPTAGIHGRCSTTISIV